MNRELKLIRAFYKRVAEWDKVEVGRNVASELRVVLDEWKRFAKQRTPKEKTKP